MTSAHRRRRAPRKIAAPLHITGATGSGHADERPRKRETQGLIAPRMTAVLHARSVPRRHGHAASASQQPVAAHVQEGAGVRGDKSWRRRHMCTPTEPSSWTPSACYIMQCLILHCCYRGVWRVRVLWFVACRRVVGTPAVVSIDVTRLSSRRLTSTHTPRTQGPGTRQVCFVGLRSGRPCAGPRRAGATQGCGLQSGAGAWAGKRGAAARGVCRAEMRQPASPLGAFITSGLGQRQACSGVEGRPTTNRQQKAAGGRG